MLGEGPQLLVEISEKNPRKGTYQGIVRWLQTQIWLYSFHAEYWLWGRRSSSAMLQPKEALRGSSTPPTLVGSRWALHPSQVPLVTRSNP